MRNACMQKEEIFALAQGMLSERDERAANSHLEVCAKCREVLQGYRSLDAVLEEWVPAAEPSPWFDARVRAAAASARPARSPGSFFGLGREGWLAVPALAALLVAASLVIVRHSRLRPAVPPSQVPTATVAAVAPAVQPMASPAGAQEIKLYQNLPVLEDYDMLANFDVISDLPRGNHKVAD